MSLKPRQSLLFILPRLLVLLRLLIRSGCASSRSVQILSRLQQRHRSRLLKETWPTKIPFLNSGRCNRVRGGSQEHNQLEVHQVESASNNEDLLVNRRPEATTEDNEEERYSRQVYAVGHRAHTLIRSSTVYLDGPPNSGLLYEIAKNLALSGVRRIVVVVPSSSTTAENELYNAYHNPSLDDLGAAYVRAATQETQENDNVSESSTDLADILMEYIKRLNPSVLVERRLSGEVTFDSTASTNLSGESDSSHHSYHHHHHRQCSEQSGPIVYMAIDRPQSACEHLNHWIRQQHRSKQTLVDNGELSAQQLAFIAVETAGVYGRIFTDFGSQFVVHDADGEQAGLTPLLQVSEDVTDDGVPCYHVHCMPGEKHDVSKGDTLQFHLRNGDCLDLPWSCIVERVQSPYLVRVSFQDPNEKDPIGGTSTTKMFEELRQAQPVAFSRIKVPQTLSFIPLNQAFLQQQNDASLVTPSDLEKSFDTERQNILFSCFSALDTFVQEEKRLPLQREKDEGDFVSLGKLTLESAKARSIVSFFVQSCAAKLTPLQGIIGAIAAQEALKAVSGLYTPIHQFLFFDCEELLSSSKHCESTDHEDLINESKSSGLRHILGEEVVQALQSRKIFIAGAGAIGCELLKNLAALGAATVGNGKLILTDMDTIEKSNLSRQLLFRDADLGQFKSFSAKRGTLLFNPNCRIEAHSSKLGKRRDHKRCETGGNVFEDDENFWSQQVDIVLNALDNVDARLYMDGQCVKNQKALVDAGTMGPKGNVQVVVPNLSESYASSADPPEEAIPLCTLKNFPYAIAHTIQWSRDLFDGLFVKRPQQANDFANALRQQDDTDDTSAHQTIISQMAQKLLHESGEQAALITARALEEDLLAAETAADVQSIRSHSLKWAASLARNLYVESVDQLLGQHPLGSRDEDGEEFWTGTRKPPSKLYFDPSATVSSEQGQMNQNLISFVRHGARLRAENYLASSSPGIFFSPEEARDALLASFSEEVGVCPSKNDIAQLSTRDQVIEHLAAIPSATDANLNLADFEKDDDSNGHVGFLTAASNLRAISYGIPPVDAMETRRVAGRIIPAMITTTALVSALSCVELIKLVQGASLHQHRNAFVNLALPFFAFTAPMPAETKPGLNGREYTLWDQLSISESAKVAANKSGGLTLKSLLKRIRKLADPENSDRVQVLSVSLGPYLLYANFLHQDDEEVLKSSIWDLIHEAIAGEDDFDDGMRKSSGSDGASTEQYSLDDKVFDLCVVVQDATTEEEVELPPVRLRRYHES
ncbi:hypothetical protein ACA910_018243 [Epithemia clementina (nom. ined.)]